MKLTKDLIWFDLETTGANCVTDRIIEIGAKKMKTNGEVLEYYSKFNPGIAIDPEATAKHGMTNDDLANEPAFSVKAQEIFAFFQNSDMGGYNAKKFDVPFLAEEFLRNRLIWNLSDVKYYDPFRIWTHFEGRTLKDAYARYCNKELVNAHSAMADLDATIEIAMAQAKLHDIETVEQANELSLYDKEKNTIDLAGKIGINADGTEYLTFGKYKNQTIATVLSNDPGYIDWASTSESFAHQTRIAFKLLKQKYTLTTQKN